jgi:hypothetical protein
MLLTLDTSRYIQGNHIGCRCGWKIDHWTPSSAQARDWQLRALQEISISLASGCMPLAQHTDQTVSFHLPQSQTSFSRSTFCWLAGESGSGASRTSMHFVYRNLNQLNILAREHCAAYPKPYASAEQARDISICSWSIFRVLLPSDSRWVRYRLKENDQYAGTLLCKVIAHCNSRAALQSAEAR